MSREQPISQAEEGSFLILVPPLHKRDCSCQYGSSNAFDLSDYVCIDKRSRLDQDHCTFLERIKEEYTNKTDAGLEWEVLAHQQQSALPLEEDSRLSIYSGSIPGIGGGELRRMGKSVSSYLPASESLAKTSAVNTLDCSHGYKSKCELSVVSQRGWHSHSHLVSGQNEEVLWCNYWKLLSRGFQLAPQAKEPDMESPIINLYGQSLDEKGLILPSSKYREVDVEEPERLAEALCHSQTRARNAEKQATDALTDKARLLKLLDREAISCHAYKERVRLLEV